MANHKFTSSLLNEKRCSICDYGELVHGICECCPNEDRIVRFNSMNICQDCYNREIAVMSATNQSVLLALNPVIAKTQDIDKAITVRTDLFNASTVAIAEIKAAIDNDPSIENKPYILAQTLKERFEHYKSIVFELSEKIVEAGNHQKAIQVYLNQLSNSLRSEEREKLKIADISYKPNPVKFPSVKTPGARKVTKVKLDKVALRKAASELGVSEFTLQMLCVSRNMTIEQAANKLRQSVKESISESAPVVDNEVTDMTEEIE